MTKASTLLGLISLATIAACAGSPANDPTGAANRNVAALPTNITLAPGAGIEVDRAGLNIRFDSIATDSRCPSDVQCVWAGEAVAVLTVSQLSGDLSARLVSLSTTPGKDTTTVYGQPLKLLKVTPATLSSVAIPKAAYRIELQVGAPK